MSEHIEESQIITPRMARAGKAKMVELGYEGIEFPDAQRIYLAMHAESDQATRIANLERDLAEARAALTFYRDGWRPKTHNRPGLTWHPTEALLDDCGNRAKEALSPATPAGASS